MDEEENTPTLYAGLAAIDDTPPIPLEALNEETKEKDKEKDKGGIVLEDKEKDKGSTVLKDKESNPLAKNANTGNIITGGSTPFTDSEGKVDQDGLLKAYNRLKESKGSVEGVPEDIAGYEISELTSLSEAVRDAFAEEALDKGFNSEQLNYVLGLMDDAHGEDTKAAEKELKDSWGDNFKENAASANKAWKTLNLGLKADDIQNNTVALTILAEIGKQMGEDASPAKSGRSEPVTKDGLSKQIDKLMSTPDYFDNLDTQDKVTKLMNELEGTN